MRSKKFGVPQEAIVEFVEIIEENNLANTIIGINDDGEIIIEIDYEREQRVPLHHLLN